jgi:cytochrome c-type biogenesis protein CcmF
VNNLLFAGFALVVLLGTVYPLLAEALADRRLSVGEPYFDRMTTPIGIALLFMMAVAPALPWRATTGEVLRHRLIVPAWCGAAAVVIAVVAGARELAQVLTFGLAAFAVAGIVRQFFVGARARGHADHVAAPQALVRTIRSNPRLYGGLVVHLGVVIVAVAIAASSSYSTRREVRLEEGQSATVRSYTVTYLGTEREETGQKTTVSARVRIERDGDDLGVYTPAVSTFRNATQGIGTPSVRTGLRDDVYLTLISSPNESGRITLGVAVNPMMLWLWTGAGVMALGALLALAPSLRRKRAPVFVHEGGPEATPVHKQEEGVPA